MNTKTKKATQTNEVIIERTNLVIPIIVDPTEKSTQIYQDNFLLKPQKEINAFLYYIITIIMQC